MLYPPFREKALQAGVHSTGRFDPFLLFVAYTDPLGQTSCLFPFYEGDERVFSNQRALFVMAVFVLLVEKTDLGRSGFLCFSCGRKKGRLGSEGGVPTPLAEERPGEASGRLPLWP